ncbi:hypothetical protein V1511DRAFT_338214 [Dipodascopsis uninucleata]
MPSFGSPMSPISSESPLACSTPKRGGVTGGSQKFNTSPRYSLGLGALKNNSPLALVTGGSLKGGFSYTNRKGFDSNQNTNSFDDEKNHISESYRDSIDDELDVIDYAEPKSPEARDSNRHVSTTWDEAQKDAERIAKLTSSPPSAVTSPKSYESKLPSFLKAKSSRSRVSNKGITSPSQSPTPTERSLNSASGSSSNNNSSQKAIRLSASLKEWSKVAENNSTDEKLPPVTDYSEIWKKLGAPFSPIDLKPSKSELPKSDYSKFLAQRSLSRSPNMNFDPINDDKAISNGPNEDIRLEASDKADYFKSKSNDINPTPMDINSGNRIPSKRMKSGMLYNKDEVQSNIPEISLKNQQVFTGPDADDHRLNDTQLNKFVSPHKILKDLSRCMNSPPQINESQEGEYGKFTNEPLESPPKMRESQSIADGDTTEMTVESDLNGAERMLRNLEFLKAELQNAREQISVLEDKMGSCSTEEEAEQLIFKEPSEQQHKDLAPHEQLFDLDSDLIVYLRIIGFSALGVLLIIASIWLGILILVCVRSFFRPRPYIGPEIALGRRW